MKNFYKKILAILCFAGLCFATHAQIKTKSFANGIPKHLLPSESLVTKTMTLHPSSEFYKLKLEDRNKKEMGSKAALARIALPEAANIDFFKEAALTDIDGVSTYALIIKAQDVLNLSLHFKEFFLSRNAVLSIYNQYELTDSITAKDNNENKTLSTRTYSEATLNIVLRTPVIEKGQSILKIGTVYFGYKKLGRFGSPGAADVCNINVACPLGVGWEAERNSVAIIKTANGAFGSGVMVMNTCGSNMPYLLTANHGLAAGGNPLSDWLFQFFFYSTDCGTNIGYREDIVFNGATVVSNFSNSDFALLKLLQTPASNSGIFYAGWNRVASPFFSMLQGCIIPEQMS